MIEDKLKPLPVLEADLEQIARDWLESKCDHTHPNDRVYDADDMVDAFMYGASQRATIANPDVVDEAAKLADAEWRYRLCHDLKGDGHIETGRAWDYMRRCGDKLRAALGIV